jgi:hypothetical protein
VSAPEGDKVKDCPEQSVPLLILTVGEASTDMTAIAGLEMQPEELTPVMV